MSGRHHREICQYFSQTVALKAVTTVISLDSVLSTIKKKSLLSIELKWGSRPRVSSAITFEVKLDLSWMPEGKKISIFSCDPFNNEIKTDPVSLKLKLQSLI